MIEKHRTCNEWKNIVEQKNMVVEYTIYSQHVEIKTCNERNRTVKNKKKGFRVKTADTEREWKGEERKGQGCAKNPNCPSNGSNLRAKS